MSDQAEDLPEAPGDISAKDLLGYAWKGISSAIYLVGLGIYHGVYYLSFAIVFVLRLLYEPIAFILLPIVYIVKFIWQCFLAPFRFLAKFETLYIYLGIAALVGITGGLIVSLVYGLLKEPLGLNSHAREPTRTAKEYREQKHKQKRTDSTGLDPSAYSSSNYASLSDGLRKTNRGKAASQTIMEESDSEY